MHILRKSILLSLVSVISSRDVIKLEAVNFELAITSYPYVAILFHDNSESSSVIESNWHSAAALLDEHSIDGELGKMNLADSDMKEIMDAYRLSAPSIKVFRRGSMVDYRGPMNPEGIAEYIRQDCKPSVTALTSIENLKNELRKRSNAIVIGFFGAADVTDEVADMYSMDAWGQFQAAADSLRGHATFYVVSSKDVMKEFDVDSSAVPVLFLIPEDSEGLVAYPGEVLEVRLVDWVLRNSPPAVGELSFSSSAGELYATQFFSSKLIKFILFLPPVDITSSAGPIALWKNTAQRFKKKAAFSYIVGDTVPDVLEYFGVNLISDVPLIVAHNPSRDYKYKSTNRLSLTTESLDSFVNGVLVGDIKHILKSETPHVPVKGAHVVRAVGSTVQGIVSDTDKDVLLLVFTSSCARCKSLAPTYDILAKAFQGEDRVVIAKIDGGANDLPLSWGVKSYPTLLWFPKEDKPYSSTPIPKPYWEAGVSLHELVSFVVRQSSFEQKSLRVATTEQLGALLGDEEVLREKYESEERWVKRNEGRTVYENAILDYLMGEVVFDGVRWHFALIIILVLVILGLAISLIVSKIANTEKNQQLKKRKKI